jgi:hypothetical protein
LYRALDVPLSRLKTDQGFSLGRTTEITRDEIKFGKFINRLRNRFTQLFDNLLRVQLELKGIISEEDWDEINKDLKYEFQKDVYFSEMKNTELLQNRIGLLTQMGEYIGRYWSKDWVRKNVLVMDDEEIAKMEAQMDKEGLPELPAGTSIGMPVGMPGTDFAPPEYASQAVQYDQMIGNDPMSQMLQKQESSIELQQKQAEEEEKEKQLEASQNAQPKEQKNLNKKKKETK